MSDLRGHQAIDVGDIEATERFKRCAELAGVLAKFLKWADQVQDGKEGVNYLNGDSNKYRGDGWKKLDRLRRESRKALTNA